MQLYDYTTTKVVSVCNGRSGGGQWQWLASGGGSVQRSGGGTELRNRLKSKIRQRYILTDDRTTFISNMAAIRGEGTPLKIVKIFSVHFFDMTNPHKIFEHSRIRNGEKRSQTYVFP